MQQAKVATSFIATLLRDDYIAKIVPDLRRAVGNNCIIDGEVVGRPVTWLEAANRCDKVLQDRINTADATANPEPGSATEAIRRLEKPAKGVQGSRSHLRREQ